MVTDAADGALINVRVVPRGGKSAIAGTRDGALLLRLAAAPVDGAANAELLSLLARLLDIPKRHVTLISGERSRSKRVKIVGLPAAVVRDRLDAAAHGR